MRPHSQISSAGTGQATARPSPERDRSSRFETMDHCGEYPDLMPHAIKLTDALGRSCLYVPITQDGRVVDSLGYALDPEDSEWTNQ